MEKEEAIKILKNFHDKSALFSVRTALETLHPELKESEDEKVRKAIIELVKQSSEVLDKQNQSNMLAWLEKQGTYTKRDVDNAFVEGMALAKDELEKQGNSFIKWNKNTKDNKPPFNHSVLMLTKSGISEGEWRGGNQWLQYRWSDIVKDSDVLSWMELSDLDKQCNQNHIEQNLEMVEALKTGYEKGRADAIAEISEKWEDSRRKKDIMSFLEYLRPKED